MTAEEHIIAYIESSAPEYAKLLDISRRANPLCRDGFISPTGHVVALLNLVAATYQEMLRNGSASRDDLYSSIELARTVATLAEWKEPEA